LLAPATLLLGMFVVLAVAVAFHPRPGPVERSVDEALASGRSSPRFEAARDVSATGSAAVVAVLAAVGATAAWFRWHDWRHVVLILRAPVLAGFFEVVLKPVVARARPPTRVLTGESGFGFPSGHTTGAAALATAAVIVAWLVVPRRVVRFALLALAGCYAIVIGLCRVIVGAHNAADVAGGWLLGVGIALLVASLVGRLRDRAALTEATR
jgi:membrane-associated phospholipid phosphatase